MQPDLALIHAAATRLEGHTRVTPVLRSYQLDEIAGRRVWLKAECLQWTGAFKFRGAWSTISALTEDRRKNGVLAYSSGNHGQAVALAARMHGISAVVVMPSDAPAVKLAKTQAQGAEILTYDRATQSREAIGEALAVERGLTLIKPFDDAQVIAGQGTIGLEIGDWADAAGIAAADVLVPCGGGGMTSGIALALEGRPGFSVRPVEPTGFDDVARSMAAGQRLANAATSGSICDAILTPMPGELTFPVINRLCGPALQATDAEACRAVALAFEHLAVVLEPGGAVALAAALFHRAPDDPADVICIGSGGNVDPALFAGILNDHAGDWRPLKDSNPQPAD